MSLEGSVPNITFRTGMKVSFSWLNDFGQKMQDLIFELRDVPNSVNDQIQEVLSSEWSIDNVSVHEADGFNAELFGGEFVYLRNSLLDGVSLNELEIQLVSQLLKELYLQKEESGALSEEDLGTVCKMKIFLTENKDLLPVFQEDLEKLELLLN